MARIERIKVSRKDVRAVLEEWGHNPDDAAKSWVAKAEKVAARARKAQEVQIPISGLDYPNVR